MGALCSKLGMMEGGHKVVGTTQTLGEGGAGGRDNVALDPRKAVLEAAERRKQTVRLSLVGTSGGLNPCYDRTGTTKGDERGESQGRGAF